MSRPCEGIRERQPGVTQNIRKFFIAHNHALLRVPTERLLSPTGVSRRRLNDCNRRTTCRGFLTMSPSHVIPRWQQPDTGPARLKTVLMRSGPRTALSERRATIARCSGCGGCGRTLSDAVVPIRRLASLAGMSPSRSLPFAKA